MIVKPGDDYFALRRVDAEFCDSCELPAYLRNRLPKDKSTLVIDFGCGFGQMMRSFQALGYTNVVGIEVNNRAIEHCRWNGLEVFRSLDEIQGVKAGFVVMSHVLEHIPKDAMPCVLKSIRSSLGPDGSLLVCVPNAQSPTGAYWAYEDFTHEYLFTSGSLFYVARLAGFADVTFIDTDCTEGLNTIKAGIRRLLLRLYAVKVRLWNKATGSHTHFASENIYSYELKAICRGSGSL